MDSQKIAYDLAMLYAQEMMRRMSEAEFRDYVHSMPNVKFGFEMVYEVLSGALPEEM